jgi:tetratricopeptide (TPR) repeat protein
VFEQLLKVGWIDSALPTSVQPTPDDLIQYCTNRLKSEESQEVIAQLYELRANAHRIKKDRTLAEADARAAFNLKPTDPRIQLTLARCSANAGKTHEALQICNDIIREHPKHAATYAVRGLLAAQAKGDLDSGITDASLALKIDPSMSIAYFVRAQIHLGKQDYADALTDIERYFQLCPFGPAPNEDAPFLLKAKAMWELKRYREARVAFDAALRFQPASYDAARGLWYCEQKLGNNCGSALAAHSMFTIDPEHADTARAIGIAHFENGDYFAAVPYLRKWHDLDPQNESRMLLLAAAEFGAGSFGNAKDLYDRAANLSGSKRAKLARAVFFLTCPDGQLHGKAEAAKSVEALIHDSSLDLGSFIVAVLVQYGTNHEEEAVANLRTRLDDNPPQQEKYRRTLQILAEQMEARKPLTFSIPSLGKLARNPSTQSLH